MIHTAYLSLGSNIGDRARNIALAIEGLAARNVKIARQSALYETEPVEFLAQAWFLNCAVAVETTLAPRELMAELLEIERAMGRARREPKGPRVIDMDILLYGDAVISEPGLEIPHPRMAQRNFVLVPLAEIAPSVRHPVLGATAAELLARSNNRSLVRMSLDKT